MSAVDRPPLEAAIEPASRFSLPRDPALLFGLGIIGFFVLVACLAGVLGTVDPTFLVPSQRLRPPSSAHWLGTDAYGRDLYSRVVYGTRISLLIGALASILAMTIGTVIGLVAGYVRALDQIVLRIMDGLMAIPGILLAIALVAISGASVKVVAIAIVIPEIPRVVRLVRGLVLTLREEFFVEAAVGLGTRLPLILGRHILPNILGPLIVQATYVAASAILTEAALSFLGAGIPTDIPTWGNIIAEGRVYFRIAPQMIAAPGLCLAFVILAVNLLGDSLRDMLDPRTTTGLAGSSK